MKPRRLMTGLLLIAALVCAAAPASGEEIILKDGQKIVGTIVGYEKDMFRVETDYGIALVRKDKIASIQVSKPDAANPATTQRPATKTLGEKPAHVAATPEAAPTPTPPPPALSAPVSQPVVVAPPAKPLTPSPTPVSQPVVVAPPAKPLTPSPAPVSQPVVVAPPAKPLTPSPAPVSQSVVVAPPAKPLTPPPPPVSQPVVVAPPAKPPTPSPAPVSQPVVVAPPANPLTPPPPPISQPVVVAPPAKPLTAPPPPVSHPLDVPMPALLQEHVDGNTYFSDTFQFSMFKPPDWKLYEGVPKETGSGIMAMGTDDEQTLLIVDRQVWSGTPKLTSDDVEANLRQTYQEYHRISEEATQCDGQTATRHTFTGVLDGAEWHGMAVHVIHKNMVFGIIGLTSAETFEFQEAIFNKVIKTFHFLTPSPSTSASGPANPTP